MNKLSITTIVLLLAFTTVSVGADKTENQEERAKPGAGLTVYMDTSFLGRKHRAAKNMTELHQENFNKGWMVVDVDPYIENGDLQGFFITYVGRD